MKYMVFLTSVVPIRFMPCCLICTQLNNYLETPLIMILIVVLRFNPGIYCVYVRAVDVPYSRKIWRFSGRCYNCQIKIRQNFQLAYIHMAILYRTAKFKSANILAIAILGSTVKFNSRQYFWIYGISCYANTMHCHARKFLN